MLIDGYDVEVKIQNEEISSQDLNIVLSSSIHQMFPEVSIKMPDSSMWYQELATINEGEIVEIKYKLDNNKNDKIYNKFVIVDNDMNERKNPVNLGGDLKIRGFQKWYNKQEKVSEAYNDRISNVVKQLINSDFPSNKQNFNDTNSADLWYRTYKYQYEFIQYLLQYCSSNNAKESPFFAYIDNIGVFQFRNLYSLLSGNPIELYSNKQDSISLNYLIEDMRRSTTGSLITKKNRYRKVYYENKDTGDFETESDYLYTYPTSGTKYLPIIDAENSFSSNLTSILFAGEYLSNKDTEQGYKIYNTLDNYFLERIILFLPFNPELISGKLVKINMDTANLDEKSIYFGGNWLIETDEHYFNGETRTGNTRLTVGRATISLPGSYLNKNRMVRG